MKLRMNRSLWPTLQDCALARVDGQSLWYLARGEPPRAAPDRSRPSGNHRVAGQPIPHKVGNYRRVHIEGVMSHKLKIDREREAALDQFVADALSLLCCSRPQPWSPATSRGIAHLLHFDHGQPLLLAGPDHVAQLDHPARMNEMIWVQDMGTGTGPFFFHESKARGTRDY